VAGSALFVIIAVATLVLTGEMLKYPQEHSGMFIFLLEAVASISIGATLVVLFYNIAPQEKEEE